MIFQDNTLGQPFPFQSRFEPRWQEGRSVLEVANRRDVSFLAYGRTMFFGSGSIDDWAAVTTKKGADGRDVPGYGDDAYYIEMLQWVAAQTPDPAKARELLFRDICCIYNVATKQFKPAVVRYILDHAYRHRSLFWGVTQNALTYEYYGMVAEENKTMPDGSPSRIGALVKISGAYSGLIQNMDPLEAARRTDGMRARDILDECVSWGLKVHVPPGSPLEYYAKTLQAICA